MIVCLLEKSCSDKQTKEEELNMTVSTPQKLSMDNIDNKILILFGKCLTLEITMSSHIPRGVVNLSLIIPGSSGSFVLKLALFPVLIRKKVLGVPIARDHFRNIEYFVTVLGLSN